MADHGKNCNDRATVKRSRQDAQSDRKEHKPPREFFMLFFWSQVLHNIKSKKNCLLKSEDTDLTIASNIDFSTDHRWFDKSTTIGICPRAHVMCKKFSAQIRGIICP